MPGLTTYSEVNPHEWDTSIIQLGGCCFHSYEWSKSTAEKNNAKPLYYQWLDDSGTLQCTGFGFVSGRSLAGIASNKALSLGSFPACKDTSFLKNTFEELINYCSKNSISILKINSFGTPYGTEVLSDLDFSVSKRWEFIVDLDMSEDKLWKNLHSKKRNLIRKGRKSNLTVEKVKELDKIMMYRDLALETQKRKADAGISLPIGDVQQYEHLKYKVIDPGIGRLYLAYDGLKPVAGAFFVGFNNKAYYSLSSASQTGLKAAAPDLLLWTAMTDYMKKGYTQFNLGGLSEDELNGQPLEKSGLYHFKKRFSADVHPCYKGQLILRPMAFTAYNFLKKIKPTRRT